MTVHEDMTHDRAFELLPWFVNDSLDAEDRGTVQAHASGCVICRREIEELADLRRSIRHMPVLEETPEPDMRRINARIDAQLEREMRPLRVLSTIRAWLGSPFRIAFAAQTAALVAIAVIRLQPDDTQPDFRTLTSAEPLPSGHYVRVVFDPTVEDSSVSALLESTGLMVVSGPSERGVITLRFAGGTSVDERDDIVRQMREDNRVLFAEAVGSGN